MLARVGAGGPYHPVEAFSAALHRPDGLWRVASERHGWLDPWQRRALLWLLGGVLLAAPLGYLFARRLVAPIRAFAEAAERLGRDPRAPALAAEGPAEIGAAARAFNEIRSQSVASVLSIIVSEQNRLTRTCTPSQHERSGGRSGLTMTRERLEHPEGQDLLSKQTKPSLRAVL